MKNQELKSFLQNNVTHLIEQPMISFKPISFQFDDFDDFEAIFFSSKRAVDFFLSEITLKEKKLLCCIGETTADALKKWGYEADFIGNRSGIPNEVANQLYTFLGDRNILIPQSNISNQSIQKVLPENQYKNLVVYETFALPKKLDRSPEVLVFTSPSNARSFLQMNEIDVNKQKIIAWGASTGHYLRQSNIKPEAELSVSSEDNLLELLRKEYF